LSQVSSMESNTREQRWSKKGKGERNRGEPTIAFLRGPKTDALCSGDAQEEKSQKGIKNTQDQKPCNRRKEMEKLRLIPLQGSGISHGEGHAAESWGNEREKKQRVHFSLGAGSPVPVKKSNGKTAGNDGKKKGKQEKGTFDGGILKEDSLEESGGGNLRGGKNMWHPSLRTK